MNPIEKVIATIKKIMYIFYCFSELGHAARS